MPVTLKSSGLKTFQRGHPWLFSNQLRFSREESAGLRDLLGEDGRWLAKGLLNPKSRLAFRVLTSEPWACEANESELIAKLLGRAVAFRLPWLKDRRSCRLVHGEGDHLSGLIVDAFFTHGDSSRLYLVVQSQSAGMDALEEPIVGALEAWAGEFVKSAADVSDFQILRRRDSSKRRREGLATEETSVAGAGESCVIRVGSLQHSSLVAPMRVNLWTGQKTGFFLDQAFNIDVVYELVTRSLKPGPLSLLDICCYVGQWSARLSQGLSSKDFQVQAVGVDASEAALALARENAESAGAQWRGVKADVFRPPWLEGEVFDVVVCDPPALIQDRKDIKAGKHGYVKLNALALQKVKKDGFFVSCSCSGILKREDFKEILASAVRRSGRRVLWLAEGRQSPDHPVRDWFPEGEYLKCFVARVLD
jgi:23S rRNA (cytosine1962-C5)-methyltransferase